MPSTRQVPHTTHRCLTLCSLHLGPDRIRLHKRRRRCAERPSRDGWGLMRRGELGCSGCPNDQLPVRWHNLFLIVLSFFGQTRWSSKGAAVPPSAMRLLPVFPKCKTIRNHRRRRRLRRRCVFVIVFKERKENKKNFLLCLATSHFFFFFLGLFSDLKTWTSWVSSDWIVVEFGDKPNPNLNPCDATMRSDITIALFFYFSCTFLEVFSKFFWVLRTGVLLAQPNWFYLSKASPILLYSLVLRAI